MKKILIITRALNTGGVETSLISMLKLIPQSEYNIKILTFYPGGELMNEIPEGIEVDIIPETNIKTINKILNRLKKGNIKSALLVGIHTFLGKKSKTIFNSYEHYLNTLQSIEEEYDLAISYYNPTSITVPYTINKVKAKRKLMWIHNDVNLYNDIDLFESYYNQFDQIYNVSMTGVEEFVKKFPKLKSKTSVFYNIIDEKIICDKSHEFKDIFKHDIEIFNIVTVGRLSIEKGQDLIPAITRKLLDSNINVKWYCLGEGLLRKSIEENIKKFNVSENVILLGNQENPYPYINQCDIYVQTSRSECYCTTVMEAKCLNKPMVITNVNGSTEQINHGENGIITNCNIDDIYCSIMYLLDNPLVREKFIQSLSQNKINTNSEMNKLYKFLY